MEESEEPEESEGSKEMEEMGRNPVRRFQEA